MPSPIGHALAGAAIAWIAEPAASRASTPLAPRTGRQTTLALACAAAAMAPDLDLLAPYQHRTATHSLLAAAAVAVFTIIAVRVTGKVTGRAMWTIVWALTSAYVSHLLLDWLAEDSTVPRGLQLLWPFSDRWFISELDWFRGTARRHVFSRSSMRTNVLAVVQEIAILGPLAAAAWLVRVKALARFAPQMPRGHHAAK